MPPPRPARGRPLATNHARRRLVAALVAGLVAMPLGTQRAGAAAVAARTRGATPALAARTLDDRELVLTQFAGRVVLVNFWATWCAPCVAEMPSLARLRERMGPQRLEVIGVNFQENAARIEPFVQRLGIGFPVVRDHDGTLRKAWQVNVFPTTFVIGPAGDVRWVVVGEIDWDEPAVESRVRSVR